MLYSSPQNGILRQPEGELFNNAVESRPRASSTPQGVALQTNKQGATGSFASYL